MDASDLEGTTCYGIIWITNKLLIQVKPLSVNMEVGIENKMNGL